MKKKYLWLLLPIVLFVFVGWDASDYGHGIIFTQDPTTGNAYFDTSLLYLDNVNNRIGIGTSSPTCELDVHGLVTSDNKFEVGGETQYDNRKIVQIASGQDFEIRTRQADNTYNNNQLLLNSEGNIGIYTTDPDAAFHILHTTDPQLIITHTNKADSITIGVDGNGDATLTPSGGDISIANAATSQQIDMGVSTVNPTIAVTDTGANVSSAKMVAKVTITYATESGDILITLPSGTAVWSITVNVTAEFNDSGTDVLDVGITGSTNVYDDDIDVSSTGITACDGTLPAIYSGDTQIVATYDGQNDNADAGSADIYIEYTLH